MTNDHPSLSELYKIRYNQHGGLQLNDYQKILKKRLSSLIKDVKERDDLQLHILIPQYQGNYFSFCVVVSSMKSFSSVESDIVDSHNKFSSYDNFALNHPDMISLHLDQMKDAELQNLFRIAGSKNNNGDYVFQLSVDMAGIPDILFQEYSVELGVHEIEVLQNIVNSHIKHYNLPHIQLNDRYARSIGWDLNDHFISISKPSKMATFGNERIMLQALYILQSFHLQHQMRSVEIINPKNGNRTINEEMFLTTDQCYLIITTKTNQWKKVLENMPQQSFGSYRKDIPYFFHRLDDLGIDLMQLFHTDRNLLIKILRSWANITSSEYSFQFQFKNLLDLFEDAFKTYGQEQLNEFQLRMFLKDSTFDDLSNPALHNTLVSKYAAIFSHSFFNYKEKFEMGSNNSKRRLWKTDFLTKGIHLIDISNSTQIEQLALQSFFHILQEARFFENTWTLHSYGEGLRHSFEKVEQIINEIAIHKSVLHFTHTTELTPFLHNNDLLLFDREFDNYSVLKSFGANSMLEDSDESNLLIHEQTNTTLIKPLESQMIGILYNRNVLVKLSPDEIQYQHDLHPAKLIEEQLTESTDKEIVPEQGLLEKISDVPENMFSQPFAEEEEEIDKEFEEDHYIGPDLLFKIPVLASFKNYRQYNIQEIEFSSNLPLDIVEKQLQQLLSLRWIETNVVDKRDVYYPLKKGKGYVDDLMDQIPNIKDLQDEIFDLMYKELDATTEDKIIDKGNILEVLLVLRLSYHTLTDYEERKGILIKLCSVCKYVSDGFVEYRDELESYYYWSLGIYAAFLDTQLGNKRDEHLLIRKITELTKLISEIVTNNLQHDFSMKQIETSTDETFIHSESIKGDEIKSIDLSTKHQSKRPSIEIKNPEIIENLEIEKTTAVPKTLPSVSNIPRAKPIKALSERQLTPLELRPFSINPALGGWYKYHRKDYDRVITADPMVLNPDDIIFAFMVNSILSNFSDSFAIKIQKHSLMFLNRDQMEETVKRSPLPLVVSYDNLINSGIFEAIDLGYNLLDIRTKLPVPNVTVDPIYKHMNLNEVISLIDENPHNLIKSRTLQSYIYADFYDIELQPVVAICYAMLIDQKEIGNKIAIYEKFIPWVYTMIKLFMMKKRNFKRSKELDFLHNSFVSELQTIHVSSCLELQRYTGNNDNAIKLRFLLLRKLKQLGLKLDEIEGDKKSRITRTMKQKSVSPSLLKQLKEEHADGEFTQSRSTLNKKLPKTSRKKASIGKKKVDKFSRGDSLIPTETQISSIDENLTFDEAVITAIDEICKNGIQDSDRVSPSDLLIAIFSDVIYPSITNSKIDHRDLQLIELFNEVGELTGVSNTVEFSRNLGDMQEMWDNFEDTRVRIIKSFAKRIMATTRNFNYNNLFKEFLYSKIRRTIK
ncbi:MAG: hypothetical protein GPJ54_17760 [Candidatus Heimdallarchaeota archaeon]|nr:hypothetical protein [Candidatus Heimdallarchaeota archaeon]